MLSVSHFWHPLRMCLVKMSSMDKLKRQLQRATSFLLTSSKRKRQSLLQIASQQREDGMAGGVLSWQERNQRQACTPPSTSLLRTAARLQGLLGASTPA